MSKQLLINTAPSEQLDTSSVGLVSVLSDCLSDPAVSGFLDVINSADNTAFPGFCDVHVHFREPGFSYKETVSSGSRAAARGGYTDVCTMPNLSPVPDSVETLDIERELIRRDAVIGVHPYAAITKGQRGEELSDMEAVADSCIAFSDDGRGVQDEAMMREAMTRAAALGKMIVAHCEVNELLHGGVVHDGEFAASHGYPGICSESEWWQIERDIRLADETHCAYHVCHISTAESVELIRDAKKSGVNISCETAPHYLVLDDGDMLEHGRFKMNPPLRSRRDREALVGGVVDGTIDMIATDHAPHSDEEKSRGLLKSPFGIVGLETALPVLYTHLVKGGVITLSRLTSLLSDNPRRRFALPARRDFSVWRLDEEFTVDSGKFLSMGHATPFEGDRLFGRCLLTVCDGRVVYSDIEH